MAIRYNVEQHHVCFPTKILSDKVGRTLNMVIKKDTDNGTVCGKGKYVSFDQYGNLDIYNSIEDRHTVIKNCSNGEKITFNDNLVMTTSVDPHKIQNDFNYKPFRISNSYESRKNIISSSIPVRITFEYSPYVKVVF